jgi:hypothetical protein
MSSTIMLMSAGRVRTNPSMKGPPVGTYSQDGAPSMVATIPANVAGDILILWVHEWDLGTLGAPPSIPGWNMVGSTGYNGELFFGASLWWRASTGSNLSATINFSATSTIRSVLGMVFDGNTVFKNPNPALAVTFGTAATVDPPNRPSLFTNNVWLAFLSNGNPITAYPAGMLGLANFSGANSTSACAGLGSFTLNAYDPAPFTGTGALAIPATFVIVGA